MLINQERRGTSLMAHIFIEMRCPEHGYERFKIKVIRKYNVSPNAIQPKFRTKPKPDLSGVIIGRSVNETEVTDYLVRYYRESGVINSIISMRLTR